MGILKRALVQVYTGDGKGKTTAALGLIWRMLGAGGRVYVCQFLKPADLKTGEAVTADKLSADGRLVFEQLGEKWNMATAGSDKQQFADMQQALQDKLQEIIKKVSSGKWDLIVLDEIIYCMSINLLGKENIMQLIEARADNTELLLTGRGATKWLIECADLVTQMQCVKHPYQQGITARRGVEY